MPEKIIFSFLDNFIGGVNSDLPPILLPKNTAAWTVNATLRGGYPKPRPPRFNRTLNYPNEDVQTLFTSTGFFQGAGYYRPDFGQSQLIVAISGRLFALTEISDGWSVSEITVPGDPNLSTTNQVWMNQAEKWMIISDGSAQLPIFYDGVSSRRSYGASVVLATVTSGDPANFPNPRVIGEIIKVNLSANYEGPYNVPVLFNGAFYEALGSASGESTAILKNLNDTPGNTIPSGSDIVSETSLIGTIVSWSNAGTGFPSRNVDLVLTSVSGLMVGSNVYVENLNPGGTGYFTVLALTEATKTIRIRVPTSLDPANGAAVTLVSGGPSVIVAVTAADFSVPPANGTVTVTIVNPYTGPGDMPVSINGKQYEISPGTPGSGGTVLYLRNQSDTSDAGAAVPAEDILSVPELPAGRMGAYGLNHQTWCLVDGLSFLYGDTVGGPSGTPANNYRDAVLKTTENTFLQSNGSFRVPSSGEIITSMTFTAVLDAAYGQGPLEIGTASRIFTCAVPADRATWVAMTNPILTVALIGKGPLAQESTMLLNSDTIFRNSEGWGSLIFARRNFETWGNTPISTEVNRVVEVDDRSLLQWSSAEDFDNRMLGTALPATSASGTIHTNLVVMNNDPVSSLRGKSPSIWESVWDGLGILRVVTGIFNGVERCFYFAQNTTGGVRLIEQLRSDSAQYYDNGTDRISWEVEMPCIFKPEDRSNQIPIVRLTNGKIHIDSVKGDVTIQVYFRPDFHQGWTLWQTINISDATNPGYLSPLGLGEPPMDPCDVPNNRPLRSGRFFQTKFVVTGQCRIMGQEYSAAPEPTIVFPSPICSTISS